MAPPSPLEIATNAVVRLIQDSKSYETELDGHKRRLRDLPQSQECRDDDGNVDEGNLDWLIRQQRTVIQETEAVFQPLKTTISERMITLKRHVESEENRGTEANLEEVAKAKETLKDAEVTLKRLEDRGGG